MSIDDLGIIGELAAPFRTYAQCLQQDLKLGISKSKIDIERVASSGHKSEHQFRLLLPYCSKKLKWEVIFDPTSPWFAPDFRFDDDSFSRYICTIDNTLDKELQSLADWNENDPNSLSNVIAEFVKLYKSHQVKKLNEDDSSRAFFEYSALLGDNLTSENDVEVWVGNHSVEFLIKLNIDVSRLPEYLYHEQFIQNPGIDSALLLVRYTNSASAELMLSPFLTNVLGTINLPPMHTAGVLMDYVPNVTELINNRIKALINNEKMKRDLLSQLIVKYEGAVLEHSSDEASFLFERNDFYCVMQINTDISFPEKPPVITLRSIYHSSKGRPLFKILSACPYNNFELYIEQQIEIFKNECAAQNYPENQKPN